MYITRQKRPDCDHSIALYTVSQKCTNFETV